MHPLHTSPLRLTTCAAWIALALTATGCQNEPAEALGGHIDAMVEVAEKHAEDCPGMGQALITYLNDNEADLRRIASLFEEGGAEVVEEGVQETAPKMRALDAATEACKQTPDVEAARLFIGVVILHSAIESEGR